MIDEMEHHSLSATSAAVSTAGIAHSAVHEFWHQPSCASQIRVNNGMAQINLLTTALNPGKGRPLCTVPIEQPAVFWRWL
jgi:hypothetical protein